MTAHLTRLGVVRHRSSETTFGVHEHDRLAHMYIVGKTGVGKTSLIESLARQDLGAGRGFALLDPHGDLVSRLANSLSRGAEARVTLLDAPALGQGVGYNPLRRVRTDKIPLAAAGLIETFRKLWPNAWGVRMEHTLRNSLYALLERDGSTLPDILRLYVDKRFRAQVTAGIRNPVVRQFWRTEFPQYSYRYQADSLAPIQNKLGALLADPTLYRILVTPKEDLHLRKLMDEGRVLLVNLSKGQLGEDSSSILGSLLVSTLGLAALTRADRPDAARRPFFIYVDEFQNFTTLAFASMLPELRKYGVGLTLAHQHLAQLSPEVRSAVLGNVGTLIAFRVGAEDAPMLARELQPTFGVEDLINLPHRHMYLRLMIDGTPSKPFSATTLDAL